MRCKFPAAVIALACAGCALFAIQLRADEPASAQSDKVVRIGAVASSPGAVTVFQGLRRYMARHGFPMDYVLYSNYDALVDALAKGQVDIAWNTPLAHAQYHVRAGGASQTLVMRDIDCNFRAKLIVRADAQIGALADLQGKTLVLGTQRAAEVTILPLHFLKQEGLNLAKVKILSLDGEFDARGNPCSSPAHVLKALQKGRGQAGIVSERLWNRLAKEQPDQVSGLKELWKSPPFSHCVFTASKSFDHALGSRFVALMRAMDPRDPLTADVMRLEGTHQWVAGGPEGFTELIKALGAEPDCCASDPPAPAK